MIVKVTEAFLCGLKKQAVESGQDESALEHELKEKSDSFSSLRTDYHSNMISKMSKHRAQASEVLHLFFSTPRKSSAIPSDLRDQYDAIHEMLGLQDGCALLHRGHVLCQQYEQAPGSELLRFFPTAGKSSQHVFDFNKKGESGQFLKALGASYISFNYVPFTVMVLSSFMCLQAGLVPGGSAPRVMT